ncbi:alpha/beta fold hydrolase [Alkalimarinus coralli]|uniref:alpha/beta fold hydrolase n=1 Tax=Alkalimarinus coralli TaxID=2935863 RepID=UPI00202ACF58|nr:alpha/beta fold hydrolase [Alkalimarinus coralli]
MQSSSQLFPVQLVSAEVVGSLFEDIYLLKPNNSPDRTVELAVTRISRKHNSVNHPQHGEPVILLHGAFSNRRHWLSPDGAGVAAYLVEAGFDVWIPEMRGHGLSPVNEDYSGNSLDKVVEYDLPAIHKFIIEQTGKNISYIAEGMGGFAILTAMEISAIQQKTVSGCIYIEEETPLSSYLSERILTKNALWRWKKQGVISGRKVGLGSENESYETVKQYLYWKSRASFNTPAGLSLENGFGQIDVPAMVVSTSSDEKQAVAKNAKWIFDQLSGNSKTFKRYDYCQYQAQPAYKEGGRTIYPGKNGCWGDVVHWLRLHGRTVKEQQHRLHYNQRVSEEVAV